MGISSKKTATKSTQVSTPQAPGWVTSALTDQQSRINGLAGDGTGQQYVAPASGLQNQAYAGAQTLGGYAPYGANASGLIGKATAGHTAASLLDGGGISAYLNPFTDSVINSTLADFDQQAGMTRRSQTADAARNNAFGGSQYAIAQAQTEGELARARASQEASLRSAGYDRAAALAESDTGRRQQTGLADQNAQLQGAGLLDQIGVNTGTQQRADISLQDLLGQEQRGIDSEQRTAPLTLAQLLGQLQSGNQYGLVTGESVDKTGTGSETPSTADQIGKAVKVAAKVGQAIFSDIRLKRDVRELGPDASGRRKIAWRYLWDGAADPEREGYSAQDLLKTDPHAVSVHSSGYLTVDYSQIAGA